MATRGKVRTPTLCASVSRYHPTGRASRYASASFPTSCKSAVQSIAIAIRAFIPPNFMHRSGGARDGLDFPFQTKTFDVDYVYMQSSSDSSIWRSLAVAFGDGLAFGVGVKLSQNAARQIGAPQRSGSGD